MGKLTLKGREAGQSRQSYGRYGRATTIESQRATLKSSADQKTYKISVEQLLKVAARTK